MKYLIPFDEYISENLPAVSSHDPVDDDDDDDDPETPEAVRKPSRVSQDLLKQHHKKPYQKNSPTSPVEDDSENEEGEPP